MKIRTQESSGMVGRVTPSAPPPASKQTARRGLTRPTRSCTLQQNSNLATTNWVTSGYTITPANGTNAVTLTPPVGNLFFRLKQ